ncbi:MAG: prepilin-type N-terminal cleavage/methylation domain-containing protein [Patescibacteria group bacterium]
MDMYRRGFTIIELSLVIGVTAILFSVGSIIHLSAEPSVQLSTSVDLFTSDAKQQQIKAMSGFTGSGTIADSQSIYFSQKTYTLFRGTAFNALDTENVQIPIDSSLILSTTFPDQILTFTKGSGEISGFQSGLDSVTIQNTVTATQKIIKFNKYGTIISIE